MANRKAIAPHDFKAFGAEPMKPITVKVSVEVKAAIDRIPSVDRQQFLRDAIAAALKLRSLNQG